MEILQTFQWNGEKTTTQDEKDQDQADFKAERNKTQVVMNTANIIDNADAQLFPSVYKQVQTSMGLSIDQLGFITFIQSLLQSVTSPVWGWWNDRHSRKKVLTFGLFIWGAFTIAMAFAVQYYDMLFYRAITGIGLACIIPTTSSVIADYFPKETRGKAFGYLGMTQFFGLIIGTLFATAIVDVTPKILGMDSWRFVFVLWGIISIGIGILVWAFAKDPERGQMDSASGETHRLSMKDYREILTNKTFLVIVLQGLAGSIPWNGLLFITTWFEFVGFGPLTAGLLFAVLATGAALGELLGGWLGDRAAKWSPNRGRIMIAQISGISGIPMLFVIFFVIPMQTSSIIYYAILGALTGLLKTWSAPGTNNPIFSEVLPPEIRGSVYGIDRVFEGSFQSLGTVLVSVIATAFGYATTQTGGESLAVFNATNAMALAQGMFWVGFVLWILGVSLYTLVYFYYPKDRERMRAILAERAAKQENHDVASA
jgi:MFS family permease